MSHWISDDGTLEWVGDGEPKPLYRETVRDGIDPMACNVDDAYDELVACVNVAAEARPELDALRALLRRAQPLLDPHGHPQSTYARRHGLIREIAAALSATPAEPEGHFLGFEANSRGLTEHLALMHGVTSPYAVPPSDSGGWSTLDAMHREAHRRPVPATPAEDGETGTAGLGGGLDIDLCDGYIDDGRTRHCATCGNYRSAHRVPVPAAAPAVPGDEDPMGTLMAKAGPDVAGWHITLYGEDGILAQEATWLSTSPAPPEFEAGTTHQHSFRVRWVCQVAPLGFDPCDEDNPMHGPESGFELTDPQHALLPRCGPRL